MRWCVCVLAHARARSCSRSLHFIAQNVCTFPTSSPSAPRDICPYFARLFIPPPPSGAGKVDGGSCQRGARGKGHTTHFSAPLRTAFFRGGTPTHEQRGRPVRLKETSGPCGHSAVSFDSDATGRLSVVSREREIRPCSNPNLSGLKRSCECPPPFVFMCVGVSFCFANSRGRPHTEICRLSEYGVCVRPKSVKSKL